jgi:two-component sensor histidine kinase
LFEDSRGDVWISIISTPAVSYLNRWERATGKFHYYDSKDVASRADSAPTAFQEDRSRNLWIGFYWGSLARYRDGKFDTFTKEDGVPAGMIRALHLDHLGRLWVATADGGLGRIDDPTQERPTFIRYATREGLSSDQITSITEDQWGRIYVGTGVGVDRLDPATGRVKRYTMADGLPNGFVNVSYRDRHNVLWFGTLQGLSKLVPTTDVPTKPPPILIQSVRVAGNELPISELGVTNLSNLEFEPNKNQLEIKFVSLGFLPGEVLRYQFILEGADQDWSSPTNLRVINYANLRPGSYRFRVRAVNADGLTSAEPAFIAFTIIPPVWQRWWFVGLMGLLIVATAHLIYRYHTRRLIELERVRTRIATDLHDDIGASLSKIAILSEVAGQELSTAAQSPAPNPLSEIAETSRECVDAMSDIVWAVNPQRDHLSDLTQRMRRFAEDLLDAKDIDFSIRSSLEERDVRLGADLRREVFLIFKECVNNLAKHSGCHKAALAFSIDGPLLVVSIADDGSGFKYDQPSHNGRAGMGGHGLLSMQRRAQAIGGSLKISSEPGKGTSVTLKVPLRGRTGWRWWPLTTRKGGDL